MKFYSIYDLAIKMNQDDPEEALRELIFEKVGQLKENGYGPLGHYKACQQFVIIYLVCQRICENLEFSPGPSVRKFLKICLLLFSEILHY